VEVSLIDTDEPLITEEMRHFFNYRDKPVKVSKKRKDLKRKHPELIQFYLVFKSLENKVYYYRNELQRVKESHQRPEKLTDYEIQRLIHEHRVM
jgi:hypothetical protein